MTANVLAAALSAIVFVGPPRMAPVTDRVGQPAPEFKIPAKAMFNHKGDFELAKQRGKVVWIEFSFAH
ncbi:MAG: hypothetical protein GY778_01940 [bacterium]|nr:hypothetical protein [bacterium]